MCLSCNLTQNEKKQKQQEPNCRSNDVWTKIGSNGFRLPTHRNPPLDQVYRRDAHQSGEAGPKQNEKGRVGGLAAQREKDTRNTNDPPDQSDKVALLQQAIAVSCGLAHECDVAEL